MTAVEVGKGHGSADSDGDSGSGREVGQAVRGTALNLIGSVTAAVVSFGTVGIITNAYGQRGAGVFFAATALFTLAANASRLGAESGLTYFVSRLRADDRHRSIPAAVRAGLMATGAVAGLLGLAGLTGAPLLSELVTSESDLAESATIMIRILAVAVPTFALSQAMFGASRGFGTMRPAVFGGQIVRPLTQLGFVVVAMLMSDELWPLAVAWALSSVATMATVGTWLTGRLTRVRDRNRIAEREAGPTDRNTGEFSIREYWRFSAPRALSDLLSSMLERLDVLLVAIIVGEAGAGLYGASNRLILAGQMLMMATAQSMAPMLAADFLKGRLGQAQTSLRIISGWNVTLLWPVFLCLTFGAETTLSLFGPEFTEAAPLVIVLSLAFLIITGLGIGDTLLMMTGDSTASLVNHAIAVGVMLTTALVLLPTYGTIGAAWAWAGSRVVLRLLAVLRVRHTKGIHAIGLPVVVAGLAAVAAYVPIGFVIHDRLGGWAAIVTHVLAGGALHLLVLTRVHRVLELGQLTQVVTRRTQQVAPSQS